MRRKENSTMVDAPIGLIKPLYILVKGDVWRPMSCTYCAERKTRAGDIHRNVLVNGIEPMHGISPCYWFSLAEESDY